MAKTYMKMQNLANTEVWPHCFEGSGVDGDELTQTLISEGCVTLIPNEGFTLTLTPEQVEQRVMSLYLTGFEG